MTKVKDDCKTWQDWEDELSRYVGELVGDEQSVMLGLPSKVLMMPDEEAREYVRDLMVHEHIDAIERIFDASNEEIERITIETSQGQYKVGFIR